MRWENANQHYKGRKASRLKVLLSLIFIRKHIIELTSSIVKQQVDSG